MRQSSQQNEPRGQRNRFLPTKVLGVLGSLASIAGLIIALPDRPAPEHARENMLSRSTLNTPRPATSTPGVIPEATAGEVLAALQFATMQGASSAMTFSALYENKRTNDDGWNLIVTGLPSKLPRSSGYRAKTVEDYSGATVLLLLPSEAAKALRPGNAVTATGTLSAVYGAGEPRGIALDNTRIVHRPHPGAWAVFAPLFWGALKSPTLWRILVILSLICVFSLGRSADAA